MTVILCHYSLIVSVLMLRSGSNLLYYITCICTGVGAGDSGSDSEMYKLISLENLEDRASPELWPEQSKY